MEKGVSKSRRGNEREQRGQHDNNTFYMYMKLSKVKKDMYLQRMLIIAVLLCYE